LQWQINSNEEDKQLWDHLKEPMSEEDSRLVVRDVLLDIINCAMLMSEQPLDYVPEVASAIVDLDVCIIPEHANFSSDKDRIDKNGRESQVSQQSQSTVDDTSSVIGERIHIIAPGENQKPISILRDENVEERSFPRLYPNGQYGFNVERETRLSVCDYFECRLKSCDTRFASCDYLFWAQNVQENSKMIDSISIALRKGKSTTLNGLEITAEIVRNEGNLNDLMQTDLGYRFMSSIRDSPAYWQKTKYEVLVMVRQLGIPTFFLTVSAADLKWPDMIRVIALQFGETFTDEAIADMTYAERCKWLQANPVTAARHFDHRIHALFREVILSKDRPQGEVVDFFRRIEAQARGSLHAHCLLWVKDAPKIGDNTDEEVIQFVDKYCSVHLPDENDDLFELVKRRRHSHTKTCEKKKSGDCRFKFPRKAVDKTKIVRKGVADTSPEDEFDKVFVNEECPIYLMKEVRLEYDDLRIR